MPIVWDIDEHAALVTIRVDGALTFDGASDTLAALYAQSSYQPPMVDLWDLREAEIELRPGDLLRFVRFIQTRRTDRGTDQTALVVTRAAEFGISRMYQAHAEALLSLSIRVFTQLDEAYAWLGRVMPQA